jgi:phosphoglucomutase
VDSLIISASGWRFVFAPEMLLAAEHAAASFAEFLSPASPRVLLGRDTRPSGEALHQVFTRVFLARGIDVDDLGVTAAPEIMAASAAWHCPFAYISASHNPIEYNGFKFGSGDGGVLDSATNAILADAFRAKMRGTISPPPARPPAPPARLRNAKDAALTAYRDFIQPNGGSYRADAPLIIADMNGSARARSIDQSWFESLGCRFSSFNTASIAHGILPEGENLRPLADAVTSAAGGAHPPPLILGYMPDCDGDRGNVVFYDARAGAARVLEAQEGFALAARAALGEGGGTKRAIVVNGPTSLRVDALASHYGAAVFRSEVGEANVVNLARQKRSEGWEVPLLGEGSNGGVILHPQAVRDPLATVTLLLRLGDVGEAIAALPAHTTTPVDEPRAKLRIADTDYAALKRRYQHLFQDRWPAIRDRFGFCAYRAEGYLGTQTLDCGDDFGKTGKGGLKVLFFGPQSGEPIAFIWCRPSGTEPLFRILADVAGDDRSTEEALLAIQSELLQGADKKK